MLKIAIDAGDYYPGKQITSGIQRIVSCFTQEFSLIKTKKNQFNYYFFSDSPNIPTLPTSPNILFHHLPRRFFAQLFLPLKVLLDRNNVFVGFSANIPYLLKFFSIKKILFIYDLGFFKNPEFSSQSKKIINNTIRSIQISDKIIVLSDYVKNELLLKFPYLQSKNIIKIYPGINHLNKIQKQNIPYKLNSYYLYVGVIKPSKNIEKVIEYFSNNCINNNLKLILIGKKEKDYYKKIINNRIYRKLKRRIIFLENVSDEELVSYYQNAKAIVNFSYEEGFCFPILEALSLGKKVIVNDLPLYHEYLPYFSPNFLYPPKLQRRRAIPPNLPKLSHLTWINFTRKLLRLFDPPANA